MLGAEIAETVFEPREGGRIYDRGVDGSECHWARVLAYEPPNRVVFSWDISPQWQIETDPAKTSEVEVRFVAETPERTRVELEHRNLERHGEGWESRRDGVDGRGRLAALYLQRFAELISGVSPAPRSAVGDAGRGKRGRRRVPIRCRSMRCSRSRPPPRHRAGRRHRRRACRSRRASGPWYGSS